MPQEAIRQATQQVQTNTLSITHLFTAFGASVAIIISLVAVIWNSSKKIQEVQSDRLNDGDLEFTKTKLELANLKKDVESVREWLIIAEDKIKYLELEQVKNHETLAAIKILHKRHHQEDLP